MVSVQSITHRSFQQGCLPPVAHIRRALPADITWQGVMGDVGAGDSARSVLPETYLNLAKYPHPGYKHRHGRRTITVSGRLILTKLLRGITVSESFASQFDRGRETGNAGPRSAGSAGTIGRATGSHNCYLGGPACFPEDCENTIIRTAQRSVGRVFEIQKCGQQAFREASQKSRGCICV